MLAFAKILLGAAAGEPLARKLDPVLRTQVLMVLLGLLLIGFALILLVLIGGRYARRLARHRPGNTAMNAEDWYRKPLVNHDLEPDDEP